jgi:hypothetical protein
LCFGAHCGLDVVHDVDVDVVEDDGLLGQVDALPEDGAKDDAGLSRRDLDRCLDALEAVRRDCVDRRALDDLEVAKRRKVEAEVLERVRCLVDE